MVTTAQLSRTLIGLVRLPLIYMKNVCHGITPRGDSNRLPIRYINARALVFGMEDGTTMGLATDAKDTSVSTFGLLVIQKGAYSATRFHTLATGRI